MDVNGSLSTTVVFGSIPVRKRLAYATFSLHLDLSVFVWTDISPPSALNVSEITSFRFLPLDTILTLKEKSVGIYLF